MKLTVRGCAEVSWGRSVEYRPAGWASGARGFSRKGLPYRTRLATIPTISNNGEWRPCNSLEAVLVYPRHAENAP